MDTAGERYTRDDLIQVEHELYTVTLSELRRKHRSDARLLAAAFLGHEADDLTILTDNVAPLDILGVEAELGRQLELAVADEVAGADPAEAITWRTVEVGNERLRVPTYVYMPFHAGAVADIPLVTQAWPKHHQLFVRVMGPPDTHDAVEAYLADLLAAATDHRSPYYHRIIEAGHGDTGLELRVVEPEPVERASLVLGPEVWDAVRRNVDNMFDRMDRLAAAGLGTNRGMILAGPPGTGKTALCRALALEYRGRATVTILSARAGQYLLQQIYERLNDLGPALVLVEDLDILVGDREDQPRQALVDYLTVLDGLMTHHERVVTIATSNDAALIDAAARRAARFDQVVSVGLPDREQRSAILEVYLAGIDHTVPVGALAEATDGFSGADLREMVRSAVLDSDGGTLSQADLLAALARRRADLDTAPVGFTP